MKSALLLGMLVFCPVVAFAAEPEMPGVFPATLKMVGGLLLILGIMLGVYALFKKGRFLSPAGKGAIEILDIKHLGGKKAVCLIQVRGEQMLVSVGQERIEFLSRLGGQTAASRFEEQLLQEKGRET